MRSGARDVLQAAAFWVACQGKPSFQSAAAHGLATHRVYAPPCSQAQCTEVLRKCLLPTALNQTSMLSRPQPSVTSLVSAQQRSTWPRASLAGSGLAVLSRPTLRRTFRHRQRVSAMQWRLACKGPLNARLATGVGLSFFLSARVGDAAVQPLKDGRERVVDDRIALRRTEQPRLVLRVKSLVCC